VTAPVPIVVLTQPACGLCDFAKSILARLGEHYRLSVTEISLDTEAGRRLAAQAGMMFAPGVLVDGQPFSYGRLSERKLRRLLDRRTTSSPAAQQGLSLPVPQQDHRRNA
jgi:glutaredoxin